MVTPGTHDRIHRPPTTAAPEDLGYVPIADGAPAPYEPDESLGALEDMVASMVIENLRRSTFTRLEEARAFRHLLRLGLTQVEIARRVGKSQSYVCRRMLLLALPEEVGRRVDRRQVPVDQALGYQAAPAEDVFEADEALQAAWLRLRQEVLMRGDRRLVRLLRDFASAYTRSAHAPVAPAAAAARR